MRPDKKPNTTNRLPKTGASSKLGKGRKKEKDNQNSHLRSAETIARLKMYVTGKAMRDKDGKIVGGTFQMANRVGDREITAQTGRIEPDRRWFGNTRVVDATQLDRFREEMTSAVADPYSVVLKRKKLPMGLLQDAAEMQSAKKPALLDQEPFEHAFGKGSRRKRVKLDQLLVARLAEKPNAAAKKVSQAEPVPQNDDGGYQALMATAQKSHDTYQQVNTAEGIVPWGRDSQLPKANGEGVEWRHERKEDIFTKGQSKRIWGEFYKVVDCSDVILHVIDARNVPGTRSTMIENHIANNASHKHLVYILNKIDLVPNWVAKRWMGELAKTRPTIAFHASMTHAFGKGALISLLRQFGKLHQDKKEISVGVIGYRKLQFAKLNTPLIELQQPLTTSLLYISQPTWARVLSLIHSSPKRVAKSRPFREKPKFGSTSLSSNAFRSLIALVLSLIRPETPRPIRFSRAWSAPKNSRLPKITLKPFWNVSNDSTLPHSTNSPRTVGLTLKNSWKPLPDSVVACSEEENPTCGVPPS
jgi:hypothetical protein